MSVPNKKEIIYIIIVILLLAVIIAQEFKTKKERKIIYLPDPYTISLEKLDVLDFLDLSTLSKGHTEMAKHKIVITAISRDNAADLPIMMRHLEYLGKFFQDYRIIIFENDSSDGTKAVLKNWQRQNNKVTIISEDYHNLKRPNIKFLADIRNKYLKALELNSEYKDFDILAVIDMDSSYGFDIRGIQHSFSQINRWEAICTNGISNKKGKMNDMFAFRNIDFPWKPKNGLNKYWNEVVPEGQRIYPASSDLIPVDSCFGGLAFYKRSYIKDCLYDSINEDCEHISFHNCLKIKHKGRMYMNPAQIMRYSHYSE